jgi:hypothetical protein
MACSIFIGLAFFVMFSNAILRSHEIFTGIVIMLQDLLGSFNGVVKVKLFLCSTN